MTVTLGVWRAAGTLWEVTHPFARAEMLPKAALLNNSRPVQTDYELVTVVRVTHCPTVSNAVAT